MFPFMALYVLLTVFGLMLNSVRYNSKVYICGLFENMAIDYFIRASRSGDMTYVEHMTGMTEEENTRYEHCLYKIYSKYYKEILFACKCSELDFYIFKNQIILKKYRYVV